MLPFPFVIKELFDTLPLVVGKVSRVAAHFCSFGRPQIEYYYFIFPDRPPLFLLTHFYNKYYFSYNPKQPLKEAFLFTSDAGPKNAMN
jgi:hypothetical protein